MKSSRTLLLLISILAIVYPAHAAPIRIGFVSDLTGPGVFFGVQSTRGALLAVHELKAAGTEIEIIIEDSQGSTSQAVSGAIKLLERDQVDAMMCDLTNICTAIAGRVAAAKRPLIYHSPSHAIARSYDLAFKNFLDYVGACKEVGRHWSLQKLISVAGTAPNIEFGDLCMDGLGQVFPNAPTYRFEGNDDMRGAVLRFRAVGTRAVAIVGYENQILNLFSAARSIGFRPIIGMIEVMLSEMVVREGKDFLEGAIIAGFDDMSDGFLSELNRLFPRPETASVQGAGLAYNGVKALARTLTLCPKADSACLKEKLREPLPGAQLGFRGWASEDPYAVRLKTFNDGKVRALVMPTDPKVSSTALHPAGDPRN